MSIDTAVQYEAIVEALADSLSHTVDVDRLLTLTQTAAPAPVAPLPAPPPSPEPRPRRRVAVARDAAFTFTYRQNLQVLAGLGEVTYFSPLTDGALPTGTDFLYLPGGYPELFAEALSANEAMRASIAGYCAGGGAAYAECGGLMYLGQRIITAQGESFAMVGALPCTTSMADARMTLGYRVVDHGLNPKPARITSAKGAAVPAQLYRQGNVWASYVHLYWAEDPAFIKRLLQVAPTVLPPQ